MVRDAATSLGLLMLQACVGGDAEQNPASPPAGAAVEGDERMDEMPVEGLPYARGRSFSTLDEYLAWREQLGHRDLPWYMKRPDGLYERVAGRRPPGHQPELFTREELMEKFGFSR